MVGVVGACGASALKHIDFSVTEGGHPVAVSKFFMDGFSDGDPQNQAFAAAQRNDVPGAIKILEADIATNPKNSWDHYDLGILYEATGAWDKADAEMKEAQRIDAAEKRPAEKRYSEELAYIAAHKGK
jgi:tetratricopeptide (TPR) repeat protein